MKESSRLSKNAKSKMKDCSSICSIECERSENKIRIIVPIRLSSTANIREHWAKTYKRSKKQKLAIRSAWKTCVKGSIRLPVAITLIRVAPRTLDYDNLVSAFKCIADAISDCIKPGLAPGQADRKDIFFSYDQIKSTKKRYSIIIEIQKGNNENKKM